MARNKKNVIPSPSTSLRTGSAQRSRRIPWSYRKGTFAGFLDFARNDNVSNLLQRAKVRWQLRRLDLHQVRLHVLDDPVADRRGQKIDNRSVNFRWRGKRPAFLAITGNDFHDLIGQLFLNPAISLGFKFTLGD